MHLIPVSSFFKKKLRIMSSQLTAYHPTNFSIKIHYFQCRHA